MFYTESNQYWRKGGITKKQLIYLSGLIEKWPSEAEKYLIDKLMQSDVIVNIPERFNIAELGAGDASDMIDYLLSLGKSPDDYDNPVLETEEKIKVMKHFVNGGRVQVKCANGSWNTMNRTSYAPGWMWSSRDRYRIHPDDIIFKEVKNMNDLEILNTAQEDIDDMLKHRGYDPKWMEAYEICLSRSLRDEPEVSAELVESK